MLVAKHKRKENIAEYILYLYQIEDLIRAFGLDTNAINENLVARYNVEGETAKEISEWYRNLVVMLEKEGKQEKGHLQFLINQVNDLNEFHLRLMQTQAAPMYAPVFQAVAGLVNELRQKNPAAESDVQVAIDGIYGYLLLKIQNKNITPETEDAVKRMSQWLSQLSKLFKDFEAGDLEM
ncbi:protein of unknown function [Mariniphaga anaerophila]|uniref:DUF4924 domain-containing protein n=1 Tax=Mariniphaga anaerophila TaxID=1484053 RepID=A0A1M5F6U7_9BACT|nr:DUF4924 family protein [Mariniphaga anaerophila]SHF86771.1 protein of unknown function [Mariniphaga anaerophila]